MREWFVYEPPYSWDSANIKNYKSVHPASYGHFMNDWYNTYQVRDAWWENKTGPWTTWVGNQIVVWGQSIAFRISDVVNPPDTSWAFGFANLEQSRNAQWMIHPMLNLPELWQFQSNFLELVVQPGFASQWWECDYPDGRYSGQCETKGGRSVTGDPAAMHAPSARFDAHYDNQAKFGLNAPPRLRSIWSRRRRNRDCARGARILELRTACFDGAARLHSKRYAAENLLSGPVQRQSPVWPHR